MKGSRRVIALASGVSAARLPSGYVFLDLASDAYSGLASEESERLSAILSREVDLEELNKEDRVLIEVLEQKGLLQLSVERSSALRIAIAREPGGLSVCEWRPHLSDFAKNACSVSPVEVLRAGWAIVRTERILRGGLKSLVREIQSRARHLVATGPKCSVDAKIAALLRSVETARRWYHRRVDCLVGSGALVLLAFSAGLECSLVIGVQKFPFYAHAWVEHSGRVVNDSSEVQRRLAPILEVSRETAACRF